VHGGGTAENYVILQHTSNYLQNKMGRVPELQINSEKESAPHIIAEMFENFYACGSQEFKMDIKKSSPFKYFGTSIV
jgi:hypothetical protein